MFKIRLRSRTGQELDAIPKILASKLGLNIRLWQLGEEFSREIEFRRKAILFKDNLQMRLIIRWYTERKSDKQLAAVLEEMGLSCFVAHDSIQPLSVWKFEIEKGFKTMDAFVCFLTEDYFESVWTNQGIGFALARKVPVYLFSHDGTDPKGFKHDIQAIKTGADTLVQLIKRDFEDHPSIKQALLGRVIDAKNGSFDNAKNKDGNMA